jgi:hypothetical protein
MWKKQKYGIPSRLEVSLLEKKSKRECFVEENREKRKIKQPPSNLLKGSRSKYLVEYLFLLTAFLYGNKTYIPNS